MSKEPLYPHVPKGSKAKSTGEVIINFSTAEWDMISDGLDKLLDLEARQPVKVIKSHEFAILETLMTKITGKTSLSRYVAYYRGEPPNQP